MMGFLNNYDSCDCGPGGARAQYAVWRAKTEEPGARHCFVMPDNDCCSMITRLRARNIALVGLVPTTV